MGIATWAYLGLQDSASPLIEQLIFFHDHTIIILILITSLVGYIIITLFFNSITNRYLLEGKLLKLFEQSFQPLYLFLSLYPLYDFYTYWMKLTSQESQLKQLDTNDIE